MTAVYCFSGSGHSRAVAEYFAKRLNVDILNIGEKPVAQKMICRTAIVVFPVYCQNIPEPVKSFLPCLKAEYIVFIATYGKMWHGNVLWEAAKAACGKVIADAYIPIGHTYLRGNAEFPKEGLSAIIERIEAPRLAVIPKSSKNIFADFFPAWRSRLSVKITRNKDCNECGLCAERCPMQAIHSGKIKCNCIRCLRCVNLCPRAALEFKLRPILKKYLSKNREESLKVYL